MKDSNTPIVRQLKTVTPAQLEQLVDVLLDCVEGGASVSFMHPLDRDHARRFWQRVADDTARGSRILLVAEDTDGICGTVQLILDLPDNQPHRADLAKMLVHRRARRQTHAARARCRDWRGRRPSLRASRLDARRRYSELRALPARRLLQHDILLPQVVGACSQAMALG